ncbi:splicing factor U2AF 26 kDa subunit [Rhizoctonia solani AG-1 IA]|uniref:Splicing factor U2AF 26 kDa subunit n=1 Tax=Thanatephorus cucumeris (strain AG1-IA) TaxID=983506 RepID=L8WIE2_THACA|nr:splicing factor U2AF 26 kDa subunit [Rhizoctonia solani AG-1 IA]
MSSYLGQVQLEPKGVSSFGGYRCLEFLKTVRRPSGAMHSTQQEPLRFGSSQEHHSNSCGVPERQEPSCHHYCAPTRSLTPAVLFELTPLTCAKFALIVGFGSRLRAIGLLEDRYVQVGSPSGTGTPERTVYVSLRRYSSWEHSNTPNARAHEHPTSPVVCNVRNRGSLEPSFATKDHSTEWSCGSFHIGTENGIMMGNVFGPFNKFCANALVLINILRGQINSSQLTFAYIHLRRRGSYLTATKYGRTNGVRGSGAYRKLPCTLTKRSGFCYIDPRHHSISATLLTRWPLISRTSLVQQDRVNCSFYYKIGACRHGDRCSRKHIRPPFSQTILLPNVYHNPAHNPSATYSEDQLQQDFDTTYEDLYCELAKYGNLLELHVCDNVGDHLIGNVYARYEWETEAQAAVDALNNRWYAGRPLYAELSPVTDFREACCRQNENGECNRGGFCNFMHLRLASKKLVSELKAGQRIERRLNPTKNAGGAGGWEPPSNRDRERRSASPPRERRREDDRHDSRDR